MKFKDFIDNFEREYSDWVNCSSKKPSAYIGSYIDKPSITQMLQFWKQYELERSIRFWAVVMVISTIITSIGNLIILYLFNR